jgi:hypothetical protein
MGNPNRTVSMIECLLARGQNNFLRRRKRFEFPHSLGQNPTLNGFITGTVSRAIVMWYSVLKPTATTPVPA